MPLLSLFMTVLGDRFWFKIESFTWSSALNHQVVIIPGATRVSCITVDNGRAFKNLYWYLPQI